MSIDITGKKFNRLTVKGFVKKEKGSEFWQVVCDCGKEKTLRKGDITSGSTKSCGCLKIEMKGKKYNW